MKTNDRDSAIEAIRTEIQEAAENGSESKGWRYRSPSSYLQASETTLPRLKAEFLKEEWVEVEDHIELGVAFRKCLNTMARVDKTVAIFCGADLDLWRRVLRKRDIPKVTAEQLVWIYQAALKDFARLVKCFYEMDVDEFNYINRRHNNLQAASSISPIATHEATTSLKGERKVVKVDNSGTYKPRSATDWKPIQ